MWFRSALKHAAQGLLWGGVLLLVTLRLPTVAEGLDVNKAAVKATKYCGKARDVAHGKQLTEATQSTDHLSWSELTQSRCAGDAEETLEALRSVLRWSDSRLDVVREIAPADASLAELAVTTYPNSAEAYFWLAEALLSKQDSQGAIQAYEDGLSLDGSDANAWLALGKLYKSLGNLQSAAQAYDQACTYVDRGKNGCLKAGDTYAELGQYELAVQRYETSIKQIGYLWLPAERRLVDALMTLGRTQDAIPHLRILAQHGSAEARELLSKIEEHLEP
jgi:tetratricopeptide (TPR) repeat protein